MGAPWELLGGSLGASGKSWGGIPDYEGITGAVLGPTWVLLGSSWGLLGSSWVCLGDSLGLLGGSLGAREKDEVIENIQKKEEKNKKCMFTFVE